MCAIVAGVLGLEPGAVDPAAPLAAYGVDSLLALDLHVALQRCFGARLPLDGLLDLGSCAELARRLEAHSVVAPLASWTAISGPAPAPTRPASPAIASPVSTMSPVASPVTAFADCFASSSSVPSPISRV